ncbi:Fused isobutyryl-CoA mutase [Streptomyces antimycoticus]
MARESESGFPVEPVYGPGALSGWDPAGRLGEPGEYPFTRGVYPTMYTGRPWTMRQYAGFGTAAESNARYRQLIEHGTTGLSVAFDLPTQMGYDSDAPLAHGEVGKVGVAIDWIEDMRVLMGGIPLDRVSTSMTINAPAALLLLLHQLVAEEQGVAGSRLTGTIQNDILKEYIARGTYIFPPGPSLRLIADIFKYCKAELPKWNTISISGYHMAEAGASPAQEIAFTLADGIEYVRTAVAAGMDIDDFAPRLSFFFVSRTTLLEEVAKFRAARRIWARVMREEFGARDPKSQMLRFHTRRGRPAHRPAARGEPRTRRRPGPGRRARRHPVAAHQRLRRGPRAPDRHLRPAGAAHSAGAGVRDRCDGDRGPLRGLLRRRGADRRRRRRRPSI